VPRLVHGGRALLNLPGHHSTAAIVAEVQDTSGWPADTDPNGQEYSRYSACPTPKCYITDCGSSVAIEFDIDTANSLENSLHKIDVMVEALLGMREGLVIEHHRACDRWEKIPEHGRFGAEPFKRSQDFRP
jgi:hypothetical protein